MENTEKQKLGAGIITVSIISLLSYVISIFSSINYLVNPASIPKIPEVEGLSIPTITTTTLTIGLIMSILSTLAIILILSKKALGIYLYYLMFIINLLYSLIMNGFKVYIMIGILISLIFPILMGIFIYKRRYIFGLGTK